MTDKKDLAAACGLYCGYCEHLGPNCQGCGQVQGKPFYRNVILQRIRQILEGNDHVN